MRRPTDTLVLCFLMGCFCFLMGCFLMGGGLQAQNSSLPQVFPSVGDLAPELQAKTEKGKVLQWKDLRQDSLVLIVFTDYGCPAHHLYKDRFRALAPALDSLGVKTLWMFPHPIVPEMREPAQGSPPLLLEDQGGKTFKAFEVSTLPEAVVLQRGLPQKARSGQPSWTVRYRGGLDQDPSGQKARVREDLKEALRDLALSPYVRIPRTKVHGCPYPLPFRP